MSKLTYQGTWDQVKGRLKKTYGTLTDDDLTYAEGRDEEFIGKLKTKLGKTEDEIRKLVAQ